MLASLHVQRPPVVLVTAVVEILPFVQYHPLPLGKAIACVPEKEGPTLVYSIYSFVETRASVARRLSVPSHGRAFQKRFTHQSNKTQACLPGRETCRCRASLPAV